MRILRFTSGLIKRIILCFLLFLLILPTTLPARTGSIYRDISYLQNFSIRYDYPPREGKLLKAATDRNGNIQVLSETGLLRPRNGQFLFPGVLVPDFQDKPLSDKKIRDVTVYQNQFVYLTNQAVLSNAWAGRLYVPHPMPDATLFAGGMDFTFLISNGEKLLLLNDNKVLWEGGFPDPPVKEIQFEEAGNRFWILGKSSLYAFRVDNKTLSPVQNNSSITCIRLTNDRLIAGTANGYLEISLSTCRTSGILHHRMPWPELTTIAEINGNLWFGSTRGAMMLRNDGKYDYFASKRWLPSDSVIHISPGSDHSVLILTTGGLANICSKEMTLHEKAMFYEKQVRERHIRLGLNATISNLSNGDVTSGSTEDSDNDGLWTSMYLASQAFRYSVTHSEEALQNVRESLDAMERLYSVNGLNSGFPSRSFLRRGYKYSDPAWRRAPDPEWDWKSTTSSDEAIGHIFSFGMIAELVKDTEIRNKAVLLIDTLMSHILRNDFYLVDWDDKPTRWGRWNPEYVNEILPMVGDRKLNSSNIVSMLQTAWHFTKKEKYRKALVTLLYDKGYLANLMRPMEQIGAAPEGTDAQSEMLSDGWNHSDDEMYFLGYWGLYRYALNDSLKAAFGKAILDHWESEKPEKEGLWNIMTALTGTESFDLQEAIWYLQEYPLDLISWTITNSHRKDIDFVKPNFRNQTISEVLPPDELPVSRHNSNRFRLDEKGEGRSEYSAGDIWLLPYWMGRYLKIISGPVK
jgi:hypothetical protein